MEYIPKIYRSISGKQISDKIDKEMANSQFTNSEYLIHKRDQQAMENVKRAAHLHYKNSQQEPVVVLVFGAAHDFSHYCRQDGIVLKAQNFSYVPDSFKSIAYSQKSQNPAILVPAQQGSQASKNASSENNE